MLVVVTSTKEPCSVRIGSSIQCDRVDVIDLELVFGAALLA